MSLIQGLQGLCPCPKCLIPNTVLSNLSENYELRTAANISQLLCEVSHLPATTWEEKLKEQGLRPVEVSPIVVFLNFGNAYCSIRIRSIN